MKKDAPGGCAGHQLTRFHYKYLALLCQMDIGIWWNLLVLVWTETDIDMVKQVLSDKFGYYPKNDPSPHLPSSRREELGHHKWTRLGSPSEGGQPCIHHGQAQDDDEDDSIHDDGGVGSTDAPR